MQKVSILGYGVYVPCYRLKIAEIASVWGKNGKDVERSLGIIEKSVAGVDEDAVTLAYEAATSAVARAGIKASNLEVCLVGSESHPYAVNPTSTIVAELLGVGKNYMAADLEFACKAATAGIVATCGLIGSGMVEFALVVGTDTAQAKPHDILEYTAASAAAAFVVGKHTKNSLADIIETASFSSDTPDFWRRDGVRFPSHGGRFTGEPAYFAHVLGASLRLLGKTHTKSHDYHYCVFHMPNGKFPRAVGKRLGFTDRQLAPSLIFDHIGNPYSASSLTGLAAVLDMAKPGERIFMVSYGSGAGSDAFSLQVGKGIIARRNKALKFSDYLTRKTTISYVQYLKLRGKI